jgi:Ca2+/Na+ antiporter
MKIHHTVIVMFIGSFMIQYFLMPPIMVNNRVYITNNIGKAYLATIMGLLMVLLEVMMHDQQYKVLSYNYYIILVVLLALFVYLYRTQVAIKDKQYLEAMIEHHSMGIFTSEEILKKTDSFDVTKLAKNIIQQQKDEIRMMQELVKKY